MKDNIARAHAVMALFAAFRFQPHCSSLVAARVAWACVAAACRAWPAPRLPAASPAPSPHWPRTTWPCEPPDLGDFLGGHESDPTAHCAP